MYELKKIEKHFPGVHALKSVDFDVKRGEIVGLVGENGAGKSTLMKVIYGAYRPDSGTITKDGSDVSYSTPREALAAGIGMVFQEQSLIPNLSVMENIFLGYEEQFQKAGLINWRAMSEAARQQLKKVKLDIDPKSKTSSLSFAQRQLVELAKVLTLEERIKGDLVILLDEPTSVLSNEEVQLLFSIIRDLTVRASFIFVSHRMDEVLAISDRIYVMKDGAVVDVVTKGNATIEAIQQKMVGRTVEKEYYREPRQKPFDSSKTLVELDHVSLPGRVHDISFKLHAGEVLCLVGAEGSGREVIVRAIYGMISPTAGSLKVKGKVLPHVTPGAAAEAGVGYVPRERKIEGIVSGMNVYENMTLSQQNRFSHFGVLKIGAEKILAREWIKKLAIKASSENVDCGNLSGGNQQKVVLSKWRSGGSNIMLLDHPTRGLDIGAKEDVYEMVRDMCDDGVGILLVADTFEEAIGLAHTIIVIKDGRMQKRFDYKGTTKPTPYDLLHAMV
jgi:ribose transport system ATP-binding protein